MWAALTIHAHVLSKGLWENNIVALFNEVAHGPSITVNVPTSKALVGHVKEHQQISFLLKRKIQVYSQNLTNKGGQYFFSNFTFHFRFNEYKNLHLDHISHFFPLLWPWVYSSGIVSTCMQDNHTLLWDFLRETIKQISTELSADHTLQ